MPPLQPLEDGSPPAVAGVTPGGNRRRLFARLAAAGRAVLRYQSWPAFVHITLLALLGLGWSLASEPVKPAALLENSVLRAVLIGIPWALFVGRGVLAEMAAPGGKVAGALLGAIVLLGIVLRFRLPPLPYHSDNWMQWLVGRVAHEPELDRYAAGYPLFMRLFLPFGGAERAIFIGNQVAGALCVPAIYLCVRSLFRDPKLALWAALLMATQPMQVRLSSSESMQIVPLLFSLLAIAGIRGHARFGSRALLAAGLCAFGYAVLTRPEASSLAVALPFAYLERSAWPRLRDKWLFGGVALAFLIGLPMALGAVSYNSRLEKLTSFDWIAGTVTEAARAAGSPQMLTLRMAGAGFVLLLLDSIPGTLVILLALAARLAVTGYERDPGNELQLLGADMTWIVIAAAAVPTVLIRLCRRRRPLQAALTAVLAGLVVWVTARAPFLHLTWDVHQEWSFFTGQAAKVAAATPDMPLVRGLRDLASPSLPGYKFPDRRVAHVDDLLEGNVRPPVLYYRGLDCFRYGGGEGFLKGPLNPLCGAVETRFHLVPLASTRITAPDYAGNPAPPMEIAFFLIDGPRR